MKIGELETNCPIPTHRAKKYRLLYMNLDRMVVKQSFMLIPEDGEKLSLSSVRAALSKHGKENNKKFFCCSIGEGHIRIWREK